MSTPLERLRHHVTGAIERGEATAIIAQSAQPKHTPGPWHTGTKHPCRVIGPDRGIIAFCCLPDDEGAESELDKSNARLIAASPELLEACKGVLAMLELLNAPGTNDPIEARVYQARAAIDKATKGEAE